MKMFKALISCFCSAIILTTSHLYAAQSATGAIATEPSKTSTITSAESNSLADIAVIDKTEALLAILANNRTNNSGVLDFAKFMIEQHGSNLSQLLELANSFHIQNLNGKEAAKLTSGANKGMMSLGALKAGQFDKAYVDAMVQGHQDALQLIDNQLMKSAKTASIKNFLTNTRAAVVIHLDKAKKLQKNMSH